MTRPFYASELQGADPVWLLTLRYAGRDFHLSRYPVQIDGTDDSYFFEGGLDLDPPEQAIDLFSASASLRTVAISVVLPVDVAELESQGHDLAAATGELALWLPGTAWEDRQVVIDGRVVKPEVGEEGEPIAFSLEERPYDDRTLIPAATAIVDEITWPDAHESALGESYPEVVGNPGYYLDASGVAQTVPGSPAVLVDWSGTAVEKLLIAGHRVAATSVTVFDPEGASVTRSVTHTTDGRGVTVAVLDMVGAATVDLTLTGQWWVGWHSGGGRLNADESAAYRGAGEVLAYYLSRTTLRLDTGRLAVAAALLNGFKVDAYQDAPASPWAWLQAHLLPWLPVSIETGERGLYPVIWRYWATADDTCAHLQADEGGIVRQGRMRRTRDAREVVNEIRVAWAYDARDKIGRRQTVLRSARSAGEYTSQHVQHSARLYGDAALSLEIPETCDGQTVARVADWIARARGAVPRVVTYDVPPDYGWLELGAVVTLTDAPLHLSAAVALVTGKLWTASGLRLTLTLIPDASRDVFAAAQ